MREKRYYKDMKGTQEEKKEREGGFEESEGERGNKGSFCRSGARIEGNGKLII